MRSVHGSLKANALTSTTHIFDMTCMQLLRGMFGAAGNAADTDKLIE